MTNNPLMAMINVMRSGGNPMPMLEQMARQNPNVNQAMRMMNGKSAQQLRQMAENMAKERGVSVNDIARQLGINVPSDR